MATEENFDDWNEAGGGSGATWDEKEPILGTYVRMQENVGPNDSNMYYLEVEGEDSDIGIWGSKVLDGKFAEIPIGSRVRVEFLGKERSKGGTQYKNYRVQYKPPAKTEIEDIKEGAASAFPDKE